MNDDWRLQTVFRDEGVADALKDHLDAVELEHDLSTAFQDKVIVSREGTTVFLYAGDREQTEKARKLVATYAEREQEELDVEFSRWHPIALEWRPADEPLPESAVSEAAEHQARVAAERRESDEQGYPEWEVRLDLSSREEAEELAERLREEGLPTVHRARYVLVGAGDRDQASALAARLREEAPAGTRVVVEGTLRDIVHDVPPSPFAFLGGLGG